MKKLLIGTALLFAALPFSFDGVTPTVSKAHAIIGRPLTPGSFAGVHRRAMRRTYGVGANLRYHPVARAAAVGAAATGAGWGWGGWGWNRPLFAYAGTGAGWGWGGWGWSPLFSYGGTVSLTNWSARYGCYPTPFDYSTHVCLPR
jgi:hypothetical protein